ncbi:MAG: DUF2029 domain-containing protein [Deltaproteobacteria bacterium]|nr:DUF2029 domain-containing protein [Deltaproteobacteria bacterium]
MTGAWWVVSAAVCGGFLWGVGRLARARAERPRRRWELAALLMAAVAVRLALAAGTKGYGPDVGTFSAWAGHAAEGLTSFYSPGYFADYPPGYIYVLWAVGKVRLLLGLEFGTPAFLVLLKLPAIAADAAAVWLFDRLARREGWGAAALPVAALYAFNPAVIANSAVWGQVDGVFVLFLLAGVLLLERQPAGSGASFAAALLVKPQALLFAPVPLLWFAVRLGRERSRRAAGDLLQFAGAGLVLFALGVLPFAAEREAGWIVAKYVGTLASYPYATLNAFNLFALVGGNLAATGDRLFFLTYGAWGTILVALAVAFAAAVAVRGRGAARVWFLALFLAASAFVLSAKMHERYLFPAVPLALGYFLSSRERWGLWLFAGFTVTQFLNTAEVLALSVHEVYAVPRLDPLLLAVSLANVLLWGLAARAGYGRLREPARPAAAAG